MTMRWCAALTVSPRDGTSRRMKKSGWAGSTVLAIALSWLGASPAWADRLDCPQADRLRTLKRRPSEVFAAVRACRAAQQRAKQATRQTERASRAAERRREPAPKPRQAPSANWASSFPPASVVVNAFPGSDELATTARGHAALMILKQLIVALADARLDDFDNVQGAPPAATARFSEYKKFLDAADLPAPVDESAFAYVENYELRRAVVTKFLDPTTQAAYWSTPDGQRRLTEASQGGPFGSEARSQRAEAPLAELRSARAAAQTKAIVRDDMAKAKAAKVDLTVFGVELGERLSVAPCAAGMFDQTSVTCRDTNPLGSLLGKMLVGGSLKQVAGTVDNHVRLAADRCPDWADCMLMVTTKGGVALAAYFLTRGGNEAADQAKIVSLLKKKYGAPSPSDSYSECKLTYRGEQVATTKKAKEFYWHLPGLNVGYVPYGSVNNCSQGYVRVETTAYEALADDAEKAHDAAQPKM